MYCYPHAADQVVWGSCVSSSSGVWGEAPTANYFGRFIRNVLQLYACFTIHVYCVHGSSDRTPRLLYHCACHVYATVHNTDSIYVSKLGAVKITRYMYSSLHYGLQCSCTSMSDYRLSVMMPNDEQHWCIINAFCDQKDNRWLRFEIRNEIHVEKSIISQNKVPKLNNGQIAGGAAHLLWALPYFHHCFCLLPTWNMCGDFKQQQWFRYSSYLFNKPQWTADMRYESCEHFSSLTLRLHINPVNNGIKLISPETRVSGLHLCGWHYRAYE